MNWTGCLFLVVASMDLIISTGLASRIPSSPPTPPSKQTSSSSDDTAANVLMTSQHVPGAMSPFHASPVTPPHTPAQNGQQPHLISPTFGNRRGSSPGVLHASSQFTDDLKQAQGYAFDTPDHHAMIDPAFHHLLTLPPPSMSSQATLHPGKQQHSPKSSSISSSMSSGYTKGRDALRRPLSNDMSDVEDVSSMKSYVPHASIMSLLDAYPEDKEEPYIPTKKPTQVNFSKFTPLPSAFHDEQHSGLASADTRSMIFQYLSCTDIRNVLLTGKQMHAVLTHHDLDSCVRDMKQGLVRIGQEYTTGPEKEFMGDADWKTCDNDIAQWKQHAQMAISVVQYIEQRDAHWLPDTPWMTAVVRDVIALNGLVRVMRCLAQDRQQEQVYNLSAWMIIPENFKDRFCQDLFYQRLRDNRDPREYTEPMLVPGTCPEATTPEPWWHSD